MEKRIKYSYYWPDDLLTYISTYLNFDELSRINMANKQFYELFSIHNKDIRDRLTYLFNRYKIEWRNSSSKKYAIDPSSYHLFLKNENGIRLERIQENFILRMEREMGETNFDLWFKYKDSSSYYPVIVMAIFNDFISKWDFVIQILYSIRRIKVKLDTSSLCIIRDTVKFDPRPVNYDPREELKQYEKIRYRDPICLMYNFYPSVIPKKVVKHVCGREIILQSQREFCGGRWYIEKKRKFYKYEKEPHIFDITFDSLTSCSKKLYTFEDHSLGEKCYYCSGSSCAGLKLQIVFVFTEDKNISTRKSIPERTPSDYDPKDTLHLWICGTCEANSNHFFGKNKDIIFVFTDGFAVYNCTYLLY